MHKTPPDLNAIFKKHNDILKLWEGLTPLARNEWICWVTNVKRGETRIKHIERLCIDLRKGKHRPCCWAGCPHR